MTMDSQTESYMLTRCIQDNIRKLIFKSFESVDFSAICAIPLVAYYVLLE